MCMESEPPDEYDLAEREASDALRHLQAAYSTSLLGDQPSPMTSGLASSAIKATLAMFIKWWPTYTPDGAFYTRRIPPWWFLTGHRHGPMRPWHETTGTLISDREQAPAA